MQYTPLDAEEIVELEERLLDILKEDLHVILLRLNRSEQLGNLLSMLGHAELLKKNDNGYIPLTDRKIVVLGDSSMSVNDVQKTITKFGISKDRVELHLEYKPNGFNIDTLKYSLDYSLVLLGPMPHSMAGKDEYTSIITRMEGEAGFPPVKRLMAGDELKITKTSIKGAMEDAISRGLIAC